MNTQSRMLEVFGATGSATASADWHRYSAAYQAQDYTGALKIALRACRSSPRNVNIVTNIAVCHLRLGQLDEAIAFAERALGIDPESFVACDVLSHAHGEKGDADAVRHYGLRALELRARVFGREPGDARDVTPPPPPSPETRAHNIIAFSLFGNRSRYCETAILNALAQPSVYPDWSCLFYVDESVPIDVVERLRAAGAVVVLIDPAMKRWPGTMWRFVAADIPGVHRILFRDADSLISKRERPLVEAWIESRRKFHHIRDWHTHTELVHAGLWGMVGGALPEMRPMIARYLRTPPTSAHFADQFFLRQMVWPSLRLDLLAHDRLFGFMGGMSHQAGPGRGEAHIGANIAHRGFRQPVPLPDGVAVVWELQERVKVQPGQPDFRCICSYTAISHGGHLTDFLPGPYRRRLGRDMRIVLHRPKGW